jgi:hypothetical protein
MTGQKKELFRVDREELLRRIIAALRQGMRDPDSLRAFQATGLALRGFGIESDEVARIKVYDMEEFSSLVRRAEDELAKDLLGVDKIDHGRRQRKGMQRCGEDTV